MSSTYRYLLALIALAALPGTLLAGGAYAVYESESDFDTVMEGAKMAIQEVAYVDQANKGILKKDMPFARI